MTPLISVVMPAYNAEKYIAEAIESVLQQTYKNWELIIVDDCSSDNTWRIIQTLSCKDSRIKSYRLEKNSGSAYIPRKKAIDISNSEWIINLDADDYLNDEYIEELYLRQIETNASIILAQMVFIDEKGFLQSKLIPNDNFDFSQIVSGSKACGLTLERWEIGANGALINKKIYEEAWRKYGFSYTGMNADELLTRQLLLSSVTVAFNKSSYYYRINPQSITRFFSIKSFDILQTNFLLKNLIISNYSAESIEVQKIKNQEWNGVKHSIFLMEKNKKDMSPLILKQIDNSIYNIWKNLDWSFIKSKYYTISFEHHYKSYKRLVRLTIIIKSLKDNIKHYSIILFKYPNNK